MKRCRKCLVPKALDEFYAKPGSKDGVAGICKICQKAYYQGRYNRKRPVTPDGSKFCPHCKQTLPVEQFGENAARPDGRQVYCLECWPKYMKFWRKRPEAGFAASQKQIAKQRTPVGKMKHYARLFTHLAIKFGYLVPQPCETEGCEVMAATPHHTQYEKPLDGILWLCQKHHLAAHGGRWDG